MNWKIVNNIFNYLILGLSCIGIGSILILSIIGGIQSGDLTLIGLPIWLWNHKEIVYLFLGLFTIGGILGALLALLEKEEKKDDIDPGDRAISMLLFLFICGTFWPAIWGVFAVAWLRDKLGGNNE